MFLIYKQVTYCHNHVINVRTSNLVPTRLVEWKCCQEEIEIRNRGQQQEIYEQEKIKKKKILTKYPRGIRRKRV